jgi:hypothetical protein
VFTLIYILSAAIGIAVPVLLSWHLYLVARGETSIEAHDNEYFTKRAREQDMVSLGHCDEQDTELMRVNSGMSIPMIWDGGRICSSVSILALGGCEFFRERLSALADPLQIILDVTHSKTLRPRILGLDVPAQPSGRTRGSQGPRGR